MGRRGNTHAEDTGNTRDREEAKNSAPDMLDVQFNCELSHLKSWCAGLPGSESKDCHSSRGIRGGVGAGRDRDGDGDEPVDQERPDTARVGAQSDMNVGDGGSGEGGARVQARVQCSERWPLWVMLTNGKEYGCDFIVSATGVVPNTDALGPEYKRGPDGGVLVDNHMRAVFNPEAGVAMGTIPAGACHGDTPSRVSSSRGGEELKAGARAQGAEGEGCGKKSDPAGVVFAAGDCCCMEWPKDESPHWFQMRLWSQARLSALFAAKCMAGFEDELGAGGSFLLFSHATRFFGYQVSLLGHFNGQGLGPGVCDYVSRHMVVTGNGRLRGARGVNVDQQDRIRRAGAGAGGGVWKQTGLGSRALEEGKVISENVSGMAPSSASGDVVEGCDSSASASDMDADVDVLVRVVPGVEYIKVIVVGGRVQGAMLVGDTGLEETFENLILNQMDVSTFGAGLLSEDVDIEDFFD